jgi:hypothetical protein
MLVTARLPITRRLLVLLAAMHDDGSGPLSVEVLRPAEDDGPGDQDLRITHNDGTELSERETTHIRGVLAAHRVQPIK